MRLFQRKLLAFARLFVCHRSSGFSSWRSPRYLFLCLWREINPIHSVFLLPLYPTCLLPGSCREAVFGVPSKACWYPPLDNQALGVLFTCVTHAHVALSLTTRLHRLLRIITSECLGRLRESPSGQKDAISAPTALVTWDKEIDFFLPGRGVEGTLAAGGMPWLLGDVY